MPTVGMKRVKYFQIQYFCSAHFKPAPHSNVFQKKITTLINSARGILAIT